MTVNDVVKKLRVMLSADEAVVTETEFADVNLVDGSVVYTDGEVEVGAILLVRVEDGEESPFAPEGLHETEEGQLITVGPNGEIMEIAEVSGEEVTEEEVTEEVMEEVVVEAPVETEAVPATEELLEGIANLIAPFTEEISSLTQEVVDLKSRFNKIAGEPAASPIRNTFSETKLAKKTMEANRMDALKAIRNSK
jgi:hypothetical protein